jgi:hypothetical protein
VALPIGEPSGVARLFVHQDGTVQVQGFDPSFELGLNGLSFRCGPSGENGCP